MTQLCDSCIKNNKCLYTIYVIENIDIDEVDDIFDKYINIHNQKFVLYYIDCQFQIKFRDNVFAKIEINQHFNTDYIDIKNYLLLYIDCCKYGNFIFDNIIHMKINTISCRCNMSYKNYMNNIIAKNPSLIKSLDIKENHPFTRKI